MRDNLDYTKETFPNLETLDFNPLKLLKLKNTRKDKPGYIVASGHSVREHPVNKLDGRNTIAINYSVIATPQAEMAIVNDALFINDLGPIKKVLPKKVFTTSKIGDKSRCIFLKAIPDTGFSFDLLKGIHTNYTTTFSAIQIAVWLGFNPIYILGMDLCKGKDGSTHFWGTDKNFQRDLELYMDSIKGLLYSTVQELKLKGTILKNCSPYITLPDYEPTTLEWN